MDNNQQYFKDVTLLITHYNRSQSLEHLLKIFKEQNCVFQEIVVSDDASQDKHLNKVKQLQSEFSFRLITSPVNKGLGNNMNKGQAAVNTTYTLYIQEDFEPAPDFSIHFKNALELINENADVDIIRFYAYWKYPYLKPYKNGYSEMIFKLWSPGYKKFYYYSDHPHLRRSSFPHKFGKYVEGEKGDKTEYKMMMSFLRNKGKGLYFNDYQKLLNHRNVEEPSTMTRSNWRNSKNILITFIRNLYRHVKFNFDLLFFTK